MVGLDMDLTLRDKLLYLFCDLFFAVGLYRAQTRQTLEQLVILCLGAPNSSPKLSGNI